MTEGLASLVGFWILFGSRYEVRLRLRDFAPDMALVKRVFLLGLPASVEQSMQALGMTVFTAFVSHFGTTANAAYGIGFRVLTFVIIPAFGISMATATLVGQSIGAGDFKRAKKTAVVSAWYAFWLLTAAAVVVFAGATHLVRFFVPEDPAVIREGALVVRLMAVSFGLLGAQLSLMGAIRGAGDTVMPMVLTIVSMWVIRIPLAYYLSHYTSLGAIGLWYSFPAPAIMTTILAIVQFKRQHWTPLVKRNELQGNLMEEILVDEGGP
jgi:putative MATE family efflux protein